LRGAVTDGFSGILCGTDRAGDVPVRPVLCHSGSIEGLREGMVGDSIPENEKFFGFRE